MDKSIINRLKTLEDKVPSDLIIYAVTEDGEQIEARVKDIISEDGRLKEGIKGIGMVDPYQKQIVKSGNDLKDLDRVLRSLAPDSVI